MIHELGEKGIIMSHKNKKSLVDQVKQSLDSKLEIGRSKHQDKLSEKGEKGNYIELYL